MTYKDWALSKFKPNPKYKKPFPKWTFYGRYKRLHSNGKWLYECIITVAVSKKAAIKQMKALAKKTSRILISFWRHGPLSWDGYNVPWAMKGKKR